MELWSGAGTGSTEILEQDGDGIWWGMDMDGMWATFDQKKKGKRTLSQDNVQMDLG